MMVSKKKQRILTNTGRLDMIVRLLAVLNKEMNRVVQLLRDDGISITLSGAPDPATKKDDDPPPA